MLPQNRIVAVLALLVLLCNGMLAEGCLVDNCLRSIGDVEVISAARGFCAQYTGSVWPGKSPLPTYASACGALPSRISSACACLRTTAVPTSTTQPPAPPPTTPPSAARLNVARAAAASDTTTVTVTATVAVVPPVVAVHGQSYVPNSAFQFDPSETWCKNAPPFGGACERVTQSANGTFGPLSGSYMLRAQYGEGSGWSEAPARATVPIVLFPHPDKKDWTLSMVVRSDTSCFGVMAWMAIDGSAGEATFFNATAQWKGVSFTFAGSAPGFSVARDILFGCNGGNLYVDSLGLH